MQAWASILGSALRMSLPRSTLAHLRKQWIESTAQSPWEAEVGRWGEPWLLHLHNSFSQFQVRWGSMANLNFFFSPAKKEHFILAYKCKFWAWSSNLILMCQHLQIQRKDGVLKSSEVELHGLLALLRPSEAPTLSPWTLGIHRPT